ncbi:MAG: CBS domain-containing protein [Bdellovibrionales bacterium]|nr:CBS domain-containing protein [Bdellovibrionales bacterium]
MKKREEELRATTDRIQESIRMQCTRSAGPIDTHFLCSSVSIVEPSEPLLVREESTLEQVMEMLQQNRVGCVIVTDESEKAVGIFSERDYVLKCFGKIESSRTPIAEVMTPNPVSVSLDETLAFALTLMSQGGFRHLPVVDDDSRPVGIVSVKDIVDYISNSVLEDLLNNDF